MKSKFDLLQTKRSLKSARLMVVYWEAKGETEFAANWYREVLRLRGLIADYAAHFRNFADKHPTSQCALYCYQQADALAHEATQS
jgi:hypothetical protein